MTTRLERLIAAPLLHCLLLGGAVAWALAFFVPPVLAPDPAALADAAKSWRETTGRGPNAAELRILADELVDDELLYRTALAWHFDELPVVRDRLVKLATFLELLPDGASAEERLRAARRMGLDRSDRLVRRYMVGAARERLTAEVAGPPPTRAEVEAFYDANPERFMIPAAMRIRHAYVGGHDDASLARAEEIAREARTGALDVDAAIRAGDAFYGGHALPLLDAARLEGRFGPGFADALAALAPGAWSAPIRSAYGWHVVWKDEALPPRPLAFDTVAPQIAIELARVRGEAALRAAIASRRARYRVVVPDDVL